MTSNATTTRRQTKRKTKARATTAPASTIKLTDEQIEIAELRTEIMRLNKFCDDLQEKIYVNCAYCGHRYGPRHTTKRAMTDLIKDHIRQCKRHPLRRALANVRTYGRHLSRCQHLQLKGPCTCGFAAALE